MLKLSKTRKIFFWIWMLGYILSEGIVHQLQWPCMKLSEYFTSKEKSWRCISDKFKLTGWQMHTYLLLMLQTILVLSQCIFLQILGCLLHQNLIITWNCIAGWQCSKSSLEVGNEDFTEMLFVRNTVTFLGVFSTNHHDVVWNCFIHISIEPSNLLKLGRSEEGKVWRLCLGY